MLLMGKIARRWVKLKAFIIIVTSYVLNRTLLFRLLLPYMILMMSLRGRSGWVNRPCNLSFRTFTWLLMMFESWLFLHTRLLNQILMSPVLRLLLLLLLLLRLNLSGTLWSTTCSCQNECVSLIVTLRLPLSVVGRSLNCLVVWVLKLALVWLLLLLEFCQIAS